MVSVLIIDAAVKADLNALRKTASEHPIDVSALIERLQTPAGKKAHMTQMTAQTVTIPGSFAFMVTFSIETGHPCGVARHMSMSIDRDDRVPNQFALWMVAEELGFTGSLEDCTVYPEQRQGHGMAINIVQPIAAETSATRH